MASVVAIVFICAGPEIAKCKRMRSCGCGRNHTLDRCLLVYLKVDTSYRNPNPQVLFSQVPHPGHFPFRQEGLLLHYLHPQLEQPAQLILEVEERRRSAHECSVDPVLKAFFKDKLKQAYHG